MDNAQKNTQQIVDIYQQQGDEFVDKMLKILLRAQRKVEDKKYREYLKKLEENT